MQLATPWLAVAALGHHQRKSRAFRTPAAVAAASTVGSATLSCRERWRPSGPGYWLAAERGAAGCPALCLRQLQAVVHLAIALEHVGLAVATAEAVPVSLHGRRFLETAHPML